MADRPRDPDSGAEASAAPLLEIRGLCIEGESEDGWREIVKDIDLRLRRRQVLGIIGESGAGKSTLGLAAMGCARPGCRITRKFASTASTWFGCAKPKSLGCAHRL